MIDSSIIGSGLPACFTYRVVAREGGRPQNSRCDTGAFELESGGVMVMPLGKGETAVIPL